MYPTTEQSNSVKAAVKSSAGIPVQPVFQMDFDPCVRGLRAERVNHFEISG